MTLRREFEEYKKRTHIIHIVIGSMIVIIVLTFYIFACIDYNTAKTVQVYYDEQEDLYFEVQDLITGINVISNLQYGIIESIDDCCNTTPLQEIQHRYD